MHKEGSLKPAKPFKQRYFVARELQFSVALLIVLALLGGIFLQTISTALINYYGLETPFLGVLLVFGYVAIVALLAVFFTHRLVGPFKRLEYEMKMIQSGNLGKRLSIRSQDDLHVRNFVKYTNNFLSNFEEMSIEYNKINSAVSTKLEEIAREISKDKYDCPKIQEEIKKLRKQIHELRERW